MGVRLSLLTWTPETGTLLTLSSNPQCSHLMRIRDCRYRQLYVHWPHLGHCSGCRGRIGPTQWDVGYKPRGATEDGAGCVFPKAAPHLGPEVLGSQLHPTRGERPSLDVFPAPAQAWAAVRRT